MIRVIASRSHVKYRIQTVQSINNLEWNRAMILLSVLLVFAAEIAALWCCVPLHTLCLENAFVIQTNASTREQLTTHDFVYQLFCVNTFLTVVPDDLETHVQLLMVFPSRT